MRIVAFAFSLIITVALVFVLNRSWSIGTTTLPPFGKILDPFHGVWQNEGSEAADVKSFDIAGLKQPVTVVYDSMLIAHIFAQNDEDLYMMQGYITAKHRLWQMEFQVMAAMGRISEIIGPSALDFDREQRRIGMGFGAEHALKSIEKDSTQLKMVDAYTRGVNAFIDELPYKDYPIEYKLMDYAPERWSNFKSAAVIMNLNKTLSFGYKDMEMTNALKLFGKELVDVLYPDNENVGDPVVNRPGEWKFNPIKIDSIPLALPEELIETHPMRKSDPKAGSNNWAVSGSKTETGAPLLCDDMHLELNLPSLWYAIHLNAPGINAMGASTPGGPGIVVGFNDSIAWGLTNAQRDLVDWYKITLRENDPTHYLLDGNWVTTSVRPEIIKVKGEADVIDSVRYTVWGPIVYDATFYPERNNSNYAMKWIAHQAENEFSFVYKMNRAKNYDDYIASTNDHYSPAQNVVYASVSGDIAIRVQGQYPVRRKNEGKFILDGSVSTNGWNAFIPFEQNAIQKNPDRGFVASSNQYPTDATYPYYITADNYEAYRNRRVNHVIGTDSLVTVQDMMDLQNDNFNTMASESLPTFLTMLDSTKLDDEGRSFVHALKSWDYFNNANSQAACYYEAWWKAFYRDVWDEMQMENVQLEYPTEFVTIRLLNTQPDFEFFDIKETPAKETAVDIVNRAFAEARETIRSWEGQHGEEVMWGKYKNTLVRHLARLLPFSQYVNTGGNESIVNATRARNGPSWRQVISLEKSGVKAWASYPGGQSGNPGSPFYTSWLDHWTSGTYYRLPFGGSPKALAGNALKTIELKPEEE